MEVYLLETLRLSLEIGEEKRLARYPQEVYATRLLQRLGSRPNPGEGDCAVYSALDALEELDMAPPGDRPSQVALVRHWVFYMLRLMQGRKMTGWYAPRLEFYLSPDLVQQDVQDVLLEGGFVTNTFFFGLSNLYQVNVLILRTGCAQGDQAVEVFTPLEPAKNTRPTLVIWQDVPGLHYECVPVSPNYGELLYRFTRRALLMFAWEVGRMGVQGVEEEEGDPWDMWLGNMVGAGVLLDELDPKASLDTWRLLKETVESEPFLRGQRGLADAA